MLDYSGGSSSAAQYSLSSIFKTIAIVRIGAGTLLMVKHGVGVVAAYHFLWNEKPWGWVQACHNVGVPYAHLVAPAAAVIVAAVALSWILGFLTRLFSAAFLPLLIVTLFLLRKGGVESAASIEAAWLYLFITLTLILYGSGAVSVDQLFKLGQSGSRKRR